MYANFSMNKYKKEFYLILSIGYKINMFLFLILNFNTEKYKYLITAGFCIILS